MPKLTINGVNTEVDNGQTVIQAIMQLNMNIAHYCWHPGLSIAGVCRMCLVEVEGNPKLQIACNLPVVEGMKIRTDTPKVQEAVKWALDFHLINHPLDCPICDQAGECKLQDYYMRYGLYDPEMNQRKVKKRKVVSLGDRVVLDAERCILCSRCVRFTEEVTKTNELGIFNRGDRSEIGTFEDRPLNNNYSVNTVDICPVGALTSKDFRFKQRVWFLKEFDTICTGCSTGCSISVSYNLNGVYRIKPRVNPEVNGFWMCDEGRLAYKHANKEYRQLHAVINDGKIHGVEISPDISESEAPTQVEQVLSQVRAAALASGGRVGLVLTAQFTNEEYTALLETFKNEFKGQKVYWWQNNEKTFDSFDGLLLRGDKNPNTKGMLAAIEASGLKKLTWKDLESDIQSGAVDTLIVAGPENQAVYPDLQARVATLAKAKNVAYLTTCKNDWFTSLKWVVPLKSFVEKTGTIVNFKGMAQKIQAGTLIVPDSLALLDVATVLAGKRLERGRKVALAPSRPATVEPVGLPGQKPPLRGEQYGSR